MSRSRRPRAVVLAVAVAFLLAVATAQNAFAVQSGRQTVSNSSNVCVQGISQFNWTNSVFTDHSAFAETFALTPGSCASTLYRPPGWLATRLDLFKWTGSAWAVCLGTDWSFGGGGDIHSGDITYEQASSASAGQFSSPPCGPGFYGTLGNNVVWTGSAWEGHSLWSGNMSAS